MDSIPQVWHVNRSTPAPLYKQLADNIKWSIYLGNVGSGWKLPSVRALAKELDISIDTVRAAYKMLEEAGLVIARPHHGTEVLMPNDKQSIFLNESRNEEENIAEIVGRCIQKGMVEDQIRALFSEALDREFQDQNVNRVLLVECNEEDALRFREQLSAVLDVRVDIVMVDQLEELCGEPEATVQRYKAIVTTFFHYAIVMQKAQTLNLPVYAVVTEMSSAAMERIRHFKPGTKIGVVLRPSHSAEYLSGLITVVRDDLVLKHTVLGSEQLERVIDWADAFILTHPCEKEVLKRRPDAEIMYFCDNINAQSIGILRENLNYLLHE